MTEEIAEVLLSAISNYRCSRCGSNLCRPFDYDDDSSGLRCVICEKESPLKVPVYLGESHDSLVGFNVYEQTKDSHTVRCHYFGMLPKKTGPKR